MQGSSLETKFSIMQNFKEITNSLQGEQPSLPSIRSAVARMQVAYDSLVHDNERLTSKANRQTKVLSTAQALLEQRSKRMKELENHIDKLVEHNEQLQAALDEKERKCWCADLDMQTATDLATEIKRNKQTSEQYASVVKSSQEKLQQLAEENTINRNLTEDTQLALARQSRTVSKVMDERLKLSQTLADTQCQLRAEVKKTQKVMAETLQMKTARDEANASVFALEKEITRLKSSVKEAEVNSHWCLERLQQAMTMTVDPIVSSSLASTPEGVDTLRSHIEYLMMVVEVFTAPFNQDNEMKEPAVVTCPAMSARSERMAKNLRSNSDAWMQLSNRQSKSQAATFKSTAQAKDMSDILAGVVSVNARGVHKLERCLSRAEQVLLVGCYIRSTGDLEELKKVLVNVKATLAAVQYRRARERIDDRNRDRLVVKAMDTSTKSTFNISELFHGMQEKFNGIKESLTPGFNNFKQRDLEKMKKVQTNRAVHHEF